MFLRLRLDNINLYDNKRVENPPGALFCCDLDCVLRFLTKVVNRGFQTCSSTRGGATGGTGDKPPLPCPVSEKLFLCWRISSFLRDDKIGQNAPIENACLKYFGKGPPRRRTRTAVGGITVHVSLSFHAATNAVVRRGSWAGEQCAVDSTGGTL